MTLPTTELMTRAMAQWDDPANVGVYWRQRQSRGLSNVQRLWVAVLATVVEDVERGDQATVAYVRDGHALATVLAWINPEWELAQWQRALLARQGRRLAPKHTRSLRRITYTMAVQRVQHLVKRYRHHHHHGHRKLASWSQL